MLLLAGLSYLRTRTTITTIITRTTIMVAAIQIPMITLGFMASAALAAVEGAETNDNNNNNDSNNSNNNNGLCTTDTSYSKKHNRLAYEIAKLAWPLFLSPWPLQRKTWNSAVLASAWQWVSIWRSISVCYHMHTDWPVGKEKSPWQIGKVAFQTSWFTHVILVMTS